MRARAVHLLHCYRFGLTTQARNLAEYSREVPDLIPVKLPVSGARSLVEVVCSSLVRCTEGNKRRLCFYCFFHVPPHPSSSSGRIFCMFDSPVYHRPLCYTHSKKGHLGRQLRFCLSAHIATNSFHVRGTYSSNANTQAPFQMSTFSSLGHRE